MRIPLLEITPTEEFSSPLHERMTCSMSAASEGENNGFVLRGGKIYDGGILAFAGQVCPSRFDTVGVLLVRCFGLPLLAGEFIIENAPELLPFFVLLLDTAVFRFGSLLDYSGFSASCFCLVTTWSVRSR